MKPRVYIETFGCQMNVADTERAATGLRASGYDLCDSADDADVVLINTCSVREKAERKVYTRIGEIRAAQTGKSLPLVGVMGCVAQLEGDAIFEQAPSVNMVIGTRATDRISSLIERAREGERRILDLDERGEHDAWDISPVERHSPHVAFIPIIEGCNKFCSFCIVPYSRGRERSRPASEIVAETRKLQSLGYKEIHLIGQNVNSYRPRVEDGLEGFAGATPFCRLLRAVAATGMPRIKFTTSFPRDFHPDIVAAIEENPNLCDWIHLPVQSGSDRVLKLMRRGHKRSDYLERIQRIKSSSRRLALTSDIIVGFPGETDDDFRQTLELVEQCEYDSIYIFKYSRRAGTPAANFDDNVSEKEKTGRFLELEKVQRRTQEKIYQSYVGRTLSVLAEKQSSRSESDLCGHSTCHKVVNFAGDRGLEGEIVDVLVTGAKTNSLYGELVDRAAVV
ncbi:MAG TPA: tRNA (N6-isopentenyl adenosine(37)-C2)-methylthiotransferase MiaB [Pyrinomonadaceae bacterium]|jgi:tRNA-2-methylthio-N6-dimethylallyladenosine synthase|nr:tRNA (N6-isopentenyl adenosine(37)-C2)-methylthiotransferase MiaB [Pyrinomonadaceae bacterium]